jgi:hypothetical protein
MALCTSTFSKLKNLRLVDRAMTAFGHYFLVACVTFEIPLFREPASLCIKLKRDLLQLWYRSSTRTGEGSGKPTPPEGPLLRLQLIQSAQSARNTSITRVAGEGEFSKTRALRSSHKERIVNMMNEFATLASALERFATASGHHLDRTLCGEGMCAAVSD